MVFILEKCKTLAFSCILVPDEIEMNGLAELREYGKDITFAEVEWKSTDVDIGRVTVVGMPGRLSRAVCRCAKLVSDGNDFVQRYVCRWGYEHCLFKLPLVESLDLTDLIHG